MSGDFSYLNKSENNIICWDLRDVGLVKKPLWEMDFNYRGIGLSSNIVWHVSEIQLHGILTEITGPSLLNMFTPIVWHDKTELFSLKLQLFNFFELGIPVIFF